jgi:hypothetical protein
MFNNIKPEDLENIDQEMHIDYDAVAEEFAKHLDQLDSLIIAVLMQWMQSHTTCTCGSDDLCGRMADKIAEEFAARLPQPNLPE